MQYGINICLHKYKHICTNLKQACCSRIEQEWQPMTLFYITAAKVVSFSVVFFFFNARSKMPFPSADMPVFTTSYCKSVIKQCAEHASIGAMIIGLKWGQYFVQATMKHVILRGRKKKAPSSLLLANTSKSFPYAKLLNARKCSCPHCCICCQQTRAEPHLTHMCTLTDIKQKCFHTPVNDKQSQKLLIFHKPPADLFFFLPSSEVYA